MAQSSKRVSRRRFLKQSLAVGTSVVIAGYELRLPPSVDAAVTAPSIASCTTWGAQPATEPITILPSKPNKILVHHTDSGNTTNYSQAQAFQLARNIQQSHFSRGWIDSGQHFTISRGGYIVEGRHRSLEMLQGGTNHVRGAHCDSVNNVVNDTSVGIENEGNYMLTLPPQALYDQLVAMCAYICQQYGISSSQIYGHRDFNATDCPGDKLYAKLPQLRLDVAARLGTPMRVWPLVQRGNTGERVKTVQYLLRAKAYTLTVDGNFGSGTETIVKNFQTSKALTADGIVGAKTWEALAITSRRGDTGDAVRAIQSQLASKGYTVTVDGNFGAGTETIVKNFQTSKGLTADGVVGLDTWSALVK